jgi:hypothetical protein
MLEVTSLGQGPVFETTAQAGGAVAGGAVFADTAFDRVPQSTDEIARMVGLRANPFPDVLKGASDRVLDETKKQLKNAGKNLGKEILKKTGSYALNVAGGAATSLGVGAAIGSAIPIPGIGTAIGVVGALVVEGFKALGKALFKLFKKDPPPGAKKCPKYACPDQIPNHMNAMELLPWAVNTRAKIARDAVNAQLKNGKLVCGFGGAIDCLAQWGTIIGSYSPRRNVAYMQAGVKTTTSIEATGLTEFVGNAIPEMGMPQLDRYLPLYQAALPATLYPYYSFGGAAWGGGREGLVQIREDGYGPITYSITLMEHRKKKLQELLAELARKGGVVPFTLNDEMLKAARQVQLAPSPDTMAWFKMLGEASLAYKEAAAAREVARKGESERQKRKAAEVAADPRKKAAHDLSIARMQCGEGNQAACAQARRLAGSDPTPAPGRAPGRPRPPVSGDMQKLTQARNQYVFDYLQRLAQSGNVGAQMLFAAAQKQPGPFPAAKTYAYLERQAKAGVEGAKVILFTAVSQFQAGLRPGAPPAPSPAPVPAPAPNYDQLLNPSATFVFGGFRY